MENCSRQKFRIITVGSNIAGFAQFVTTLYCIEELKDFEKGNLSVFWGINSRSMSILSSETKQHRKTHEVAPFQREGLECRDSQIPAKCLHLK